MIFRVVREVRLVPVLLIAAACLFVLKTLGLLVDGGYIMPPGASATAEPTSARAAPRKSWAQEMFNFPDVTGSVDAPKPASKDAAAKGAAAPGKPDAAKPDPAAATKAAPADAKTPGAVPIPLDGARQLSAGERAVLERLHERRQELDARARELDIRENLAKAAEKRLEERVNELKAMEGRIKAATTKKEESEVAQFKSLVTMYENMKAKDAAKIFDRLDMKILIDVASRINPRRMSDIMAQMMPESAEKLTVELATRASPEPKAQPPQELPKIEGRPNGS
jgi:flagellar motility protein MotE (MotC chaperone)